MAPHTKKTATSLYFDRRDRELLALVDHALEQRGSQMGRERTAYDSLLHPHGILELATTHAERMAIAVINLLDSLEAGMAEERLTALRSLHDEVLHSAQTTFRHNTGRVLIQMMKEIVRSRGDELRRLMLAHDFRQAATGNPRIVRRFLKQYHLLEMPESWNQLALDHHVHDSNTKGRKNPTHLIMDAWVKGLRFLTIIYYNYVTPEAMRELLKAADIMRITVRIGIEYRVPFRDRAISLVWEPSGFVDRRSALEFLADPSVRQVMEDGRLASDWMARFVLRALDTWNADRRPAVNAELGIDAPPLDTETFMRYVGIGQASFLHLAEMLHRWLLPHLQARYRQLAEEAETLERERQADPVCDTAPDADAGPVPQAAPTAAALENAVPPTAGLEDAACARADSACPPEDRLADIRELMHYLNALTPEYILHSWLSGYDKNALFQSPDMADAPELLRLSAHELLDRLSRLHVNSNFWLNLSGLAPEDVLELLWDCKGTISHLEIFNLKEWQEGRTPHLGEISRIQQAINEGGPLHLKHIIRTLLHENESRGAPEERCDTLREILRNIMAFQAPYLNRPIRSRIGTDSTSNSSIRHGMGLVLPETLPRREQRLLRRRPEESRLRLPVHLTIFPRASYLPPRRYPMPLQALADKLRKLTGWERMGRYKKLEWIVYSNTARIQEQGNVITMGGIGGSTDNGFAARSAASGAARPGLRYLNTPALNTLKVASGFIAAMLTFLYTQDWWLLAWFGAVIWFAITAVRNVIQAVLSGRGIIKTSVLRWNDYVNGTRVCDSLMYTGYSVPLLECVIRVLLLQDLLGITVADSPVLVFTFMAVANGLYIASHNVYRGFPKEAVIGNMFRSALAIPCSILYHNILLALLPLLGVSDPVIYLQLAAAVISKSASDTVAGMIEGFADRRNNLRLRYWDYKTKLTQVVNTYTQLEVAYPESDILRLLARPRNLLRFTEESGKTLQVSTIINALDLMYFWHYQPQAQQAMARIAAIMTREERVIAARSQLVLTRVKEVSQLFVNGLVGNNFAKALSFYLAHYEDYLRSMHALYAPHDREDGPTLFDYDEQREGLELDESPIYDSRRDGGGM